MKDSFDRMTDIVGVFLIVIIFILVVVGLKLLFCMPCK